MQGHTMTSMLVVVWIASQTTSITSPIFLFLSMLLVPSTSTADPLYADDG